MPINLMNKEGTPPLRACPTQPFNAVKMLKSKSKSMWLLTLTLTLTF